MVLAVAVVALSASLAGCFGPPERGIDAGRAVSVVTMDVPGHGTCSFAVYQGHEAAAIALVGCSR